jgi:hypothetical protein
VIDHRVGICLRHPGRDLLDLEHHSLGDGLRFALASERDKDQHLFKVIESSVVIFGKAPALVAALEEPLEVA